VRIDSGLTQSQITDIAKNAAPEKRENFEKSFSAFQALFDAERLFVAKNPEATERDVRNYLETNHGKPASRIISLEDWQIELAFQLNSVGMSNPALTSNYQRAPQALTGLNELWIGNGTRMTLNNGYSLMFDGEQAFMLRGGRGLELQDRVYGNPDLSSIREIAHFANRLRHYANGTLPSGQFGNGFPNANFHLSAMGIDPANDFTINGVRMRFESGEIRRV